MIKQFAGASIWSEDLNNLLPFYRDVLGLKVAMESPGFVLLGEDSPDVPALGLGTHSEVHGRNADPARHMVGFNSDDLTADWERLKAAGVEFVEEPTPYDDLWIATLKIPRVTWSNSFNTVRTEDKPYEPSNSDHKRILQSFCYRGP